MEPRPIRRGLTSVSFALAVGVLLALAGPAGANSHTPPARPIGPPRVLWSASKIEHRHLPPRPSPAVTADGSPALPREGDREASAGCAS